VNPQTLGEGGAGPSFLKPESAQYRRRRKRPVGKKGLCERVHQLLVLVTRDGGKVLKVYSPTHRTPDSQEATSSGRGRALGVRVNKKGKGGVHIRPWRLLTLTSAQRGGGGRQWDGDYGREGGEDGSGSESLP